MPAGEQLTRRERRLAQSRARRSSGRLSGWAGYGLGVVAVITMAAWLALGAGITSTPAPVARTTRSVEPVAVDAEVTTSTGAPAAPAPTTPASVAVIPTTTTSTTTAPVIAAVATPGAPTSKP